MPRRTYSNTAQPVYLTDSLNSTSATGVVVIVSNTAGGSAATPVGWPTTYPYYAVIDPDTSSEEVVLVTSGSGTSLTITRAGSLTNAYGGTTKPHLSGARMVHAATAADYDEANEHANSTALPHVPTDFTTPLSYTPTITASTTNPSIGTSPTVSGLYSVLGRFVFFNAHITLGTSPAPGSGLYSVSLPLASASGIHQAITGVLYSAGNSSRRVNVAGVTQGSASITRISVPYTAGTVTTTAASGTWNLVPTAYATNWSDGRMGIGTSGDSIPLVAGDSINFTGVYLRA